MTRQRPCQAGQLEDGRSQGAIRYERPAPIPAEQAPYPDFVALAVRLKEYARQDLIEANAAKAIEGGNPALQAVASTADSNRPDPDSFLQALRILSVRAAAAPPMSAMNLRRLMGSSGTIGLQQGNTGKRHF